LIATLDAPTQWIREIATIKYYPDAVAAVNRFVCAEPFESFDGEQCDDEYVACLFLRNESGATSWATFLSDTGSYADANGGRHCCEYFYEMLNVLEDSEYAVEVQERQRAEVASEFSSALSVIPPIYKMFMDYFREYVAHQAEQSRCTGAAKSAGFTMDNQLSPPRDR
jgi:hypothetical protein